MIMNERAGQYVEQLEFSEKEMQLGLLEKQKVLFDHAKYCTFLGQKIDYCQSRIIHCAWLEQTATSECNALLELENRFKYEVDILLNKYEVPENSEFRTIFDKKSLNGRLNLNTQYQKIIENQFNMRQFFLNKFYDNQILLLSKLEAQDQLLRNPPDV